MAEKENLSEKIGELRGDFRGLREVIQARMDATDRDVSKFAKIVSDHSGEVRLTVQSLRALEARQDTWEKGSDEFRKEIKGDLKAHIERVEGYKESVEGALGTLSEDFDVHKAQAQRIEAQASATDKEIKQLKVLAKWSLAASAASALFAGKGVDEGFIEAASAIAAALGKLVSALA